MSKNISNLIADGFIVYKHVLLQPKKNVLYPEAEHTTKPRKYNTKKPIEDLSVQKYIPCGNGISFEDGKRRFSINKQSQLCLKYFPGKGLNAKNLDDKVIVLISNKSRQQFLPTFLKPNILNSIRVNYSPNKLTVQSQFIGNDLNGDWRWL